MTDETMDLANNSTYNPPPPPAPMLEPQTSSSSIWMWLFFIIIIGLFFLVGYFYILYIYDVSTFRDAIKKANEQFSKTTAELRTDAWNANYNAGTTGGVSTQNSNLQDVLNNVLNDTIKTNDDDETEGFTTEDVFSNVEQLGNLNWSFLQEEDKTPELLTDSNYYCMSGDIFPTRDICINPKLRTV